MHIFDENKQHRSGENRPQGLAGDNPKRVSGKPALAPQNGKRPQHDEVFEQDTDCDDKRKYSHPVSHLDECRDGFDTEKQPEIGGQINPEGSAGQVVHDKSEKQDKGDTFPYGPRKTQIHDKWYQKIVKAVEQRQTGHDGGLQNQQDKTDADIEQDAHGFLARSCF